MDLLPILVAAFCIYTMQTIQKHQIFRVGIIGNGFKVHTLYSRHPGYDLDKLRL